MAILQLLAAAFYTRAATTGRLGRRSSEAGGQSDGEGPDVRADRDRMPAEPAGQMRGILRALPAGDGRHALRPGCPVPAGAMGRGAARMADPPLDLQRARRPEARAGQAQREDHGKVAEGGHQPGGGGRGGRQGARDRRRHPGRRQAAGRCRGARALGAVRPLVAGKLPSRRGRDPGLHRRARRAGDRRHPASPRRRSAASPRSRRRPSATSRSRPCRASCWATRASRSRRSAATCRAASTRWSRPPT